MKLAETAPMGGKILTRPFLFLSLLVLIAVVLVVFRFIYGVRAGRAVNFVSPGMEKFVCYVVWSIAFSVMDFDIAYFYWLGVVVMGGIVLHDAKRMLLDPVPAS